MNEAVNYTNLKEFLAIVKNLELNHGVTVTVQNDNNTVVAIHRGKTVAQWFAQSGFINEDYVKLTHTPK